jgi:protein pelota
MQILSYHPDRGDIKIRVESLEDMWHLDHILEEGDLLRGKTLRRAEQRADVLRPQRTEKKRVTLTLCIEKVEFHYHSNWLRVTGVIVEGEDMGSYHTINVEEGSIITITKTWRQYHVNRLQEAVDQSKTPKILIVVIDDEEADFGIIRQFGVEEVASVSSGIPGKREPSQRKSAKASFYEEVSRKITDYDLPTIVAGPGFIKEEFKKYYKDVHNKDVIIESVSTTGKTGLYEVVKKGLIDTVYKDSKTARDIQLVEALFSAILKGDAVYGLSDVKRAIEYNACEKVLVADTLLRTSREVEDLLEQARQRAGEAHIISSHHEGGEKLESLGSIAAFLRFKID